MEQKYPCGLFPLLLVLVCLVMAVDLVKAEYITRLSCLNAGLNSSDVALLVNTSLQFYH